MTFSKNRFKAIGAALIAAFAMVALLAGPAQANTTKVFDGEGLRVKPSHLSSWTSMGGDDSAPVYVAGPSGSMGHGVGPIKWLSWGKNKAVGLGRGYTETCPGLNCVPAPANPWDGTKVRITAHGRHDGYFRYLKIFQWTRWMSGSHQGRENYTMSLKYSGGNWEVVNIIADGLG